MKHFIYSLIWIQRYDQDWRISRYTWSNFDKSWWVLWRNPNTFRSQIEYPEITLDLEESKAQNSNTNRKLSEREQSISELFDKNPPTSTNSDSKPTESNEKPRNKKEKKSRGRAKKLENSVTEAQLIKQQIL